MSEETERKAVELTDEEMDKITGGTLTIIRDDGNGEFCWLSCGLPDVSISMFETAYNSKTACSHYQDGGSGVSGKECANCAFMAGHGFCRKNSLNMLRRQFPNLYDTKGNPWQP